MTGASGAVKNQNGVRDARLRVAHRLAQRRVVQVHFRSVSPDRNLKFLTMNRLRLSRPRSCLAQGW